MPREEPYPRQYDVSDLSAKGPLKRGDACLYCRKRRIRCSAEKPSCQHCTKLQRECVYDSGKPVSRVKQLEDKVAELEDMLKQGPIAANGSAQASRSASFSAQAPESTLPPLPRSSSSTTPNGASDNPFSLAGNFSGNNTQAGPGAMVPPFGYGYQLESFHPAIHSTLPPNPYGFPNQDMSTFGTSRVDQDAVNMFDFTTLDPTFVDLVNSFGSTSTGPEMSHPQSAQNGQSSFNAQTMQDGQQTLPMDQAQNGRFSSEMEFDYTQFSGLTPFLNPTNSQGHSAPIPPASMQYMSSNTMSISVATPPTAAPRAISIQPTQQDERVSYHAYVSAVLESNTPPVPTPAKEEPKNPEGSEHWLGYHSTNPAQPHEQACSNGFGLPLASQPAPGVQNDSGWKNWTKEPPGAEEVKTLVGGWFDPTDLPRVARDHLLDLFFAGMRLFGQEFHIPRFFASLSLPAAKRPHPCLLYTMYLMACRISSSHPIRSLEKHFYAIALEKLDESLASADRLFDAVRAATIIAVYQYSVAKFHEAFMMTSRAARLAVSCGLHVIPTSVFKPSSLPRDHRAELIGLMRQTSWVLPPPTDAVALGERIWAFWAIFTVDRCGSISTQWPPCIPDDIITTPFPRPLAEYELGLVTTSDDVSLSMLYDPRPRTPLPHYSDSIYMNLRMRGMAIFERASKLVYLPPEPGWDHNIPRSGSSSAAASPYIVNTNPSKNPFDRASSYGMYSTRPEQIPPESTEVNFANGKMGWTRTAMIRNPKAYAEIVRALQRIEDDLPPNRRTNWEAWDGNVDGWQFAGDSGRREVFLLHFVLGCSWMYAFDVNAWNEPNPRAVTVARRLCRAVRSVVEYDLSTDLDVFMCMTWAFAVKVLIREYKRLEALGGLTNAPDIEEDITLVIQAMFTFGKRYSIASYQAARLEQYMKCTVEDYKFLGEDGGLAE